MAYTYEIKNNSENSHQTSPAYVLTFTRWSNRDSFNYNQNYLETRRPLIVINDAIAIQVTSQKNNPQHNFSCVLRQGDLNYLTAIHPGDYVVVNLLNDQEKARKVYDKVQRGRPVNELGDGFKGLFKISDVRMELAVSPEGVKQYVVNVSGRAFDEFNNVLYFNPALANDNPSFIDNNFKNFRDLILSKKQNNVQQLVKAVIKRTIGLGAKIVDNQSAALNQIPVYTIPKAVATLLNRREENDPFISRINNYYLGIWDFQSSQVKTKTPLERGFNSFFKKDSKEPGGNWYSTKKSLSGTRQLTLEDFANVNVWSLIKDYSNPLINEMFTCFRLAEDGYVYPSLIVRQKPFNTPLYTDNPNRIDHTQFLDMPRWKISPNLIYNINIGRSDAARINFVQIFTRSIAVKEEFNQAQQIQNGNYVSDEDDIKRHGRKPFIKNCNYDYPIKDGSKPQYLGRQYANLVADWVFNGHLKLNGSISCAGIQEPICVGDNLEFDKVVYHIETITHSFSLTANGVPSFRTNISMSMGISDKSTSDTIVYGEMDFTDARTKRLDDYDNERVLPGFSDTQDIPGRQKGEEITETKEKTFTNPNSSDKGRKR